jgi:hypothetical protein
VLLRGMEIFERAWEGHVFFGTGGWAPGWGNEVAFLTCNFSSDIPYSLVCWKSREEHDISIVCNASID